MDLDEIRKILDLMRDNDLAEFELEQEGVKIRLRKDTGPQWNSHAPSLPAPGYAPPPAAAPPPAGEPAPAPLTVASEDVDLAIIKSPIVGTFYRAPDPDAKPFADVGQMVKAGQVLCIIEAMKLMNEINAECDGEVVKVYVENGRAVHYGERLFRRSGAGLTVASRKDHVQEDSYRQSRRDRAAHHPRVPRARIKTVAVYSEADENSLHVRFADEDVCIGPPRSADSYLNVPAIISAAEITGADAIHPGYGFLSESAYLAEVCEACHIRFIGPDPSVIKLLGDKARAKKAMKKAGVPMLPGSDGPVTDEEHALKVVKDIGLSGDRQGGGGRRRARHARRPHRRASLSHALRTAQREAEAAFGNGDVYIEKYLESPRHIEFQIIGDHHGNVVHLGERECSIQRRHQKLIEEAPSPALSDKIRKKMGSIVVDAAKAVQYTNAGTFEFLMDRDGKFYYMETNTRLQVEHPVTEMVTGIDIVKEQIRIAAGERLSFKQSEVTFTGHAIECRVNAEDPETFAPSPGVIHAFSAPGGPGVRVDTFAHSECTVTPYYDSMIAKIITHGRDRQEAIARMKRTLDMTVIEGIRTSVPLHQKILNEADFKPAG